MGSSHAKAASVVVSAGPAAPAPEPLTVDDVAAVVTGQGAMFAPYGAKLVAHNVDGKFLRKCTDQQLTDLLRGPVGVVVPDHVATLMFLLPALRCLATSSSPVNNDTHKQLDMLMLAGNALFQSNRLGAARAIYERALAGYERVIGPDHASTIGIVNNLGALAVAQHRPDDALALFTRALAGREQLFGPGHDLTLNTTQLLANLHQEQRRRDDALDLYTRCCLGYTALHGPDHPGAVTCRKSAEAVCREHLHLSAAMKKAGRLEEAIALCIKARDGYARLLGDDHAATLAAVTALAVLHEKLDHFEEAKALYVQALEGTERTAGVGHVRALHVVCNLAHLHRNHGMLDEAREYFARALSGYEKAYGPKHAETMNLRREMGIVTSHILSQSQATDTTSVAVLTGRKGSFIAVMSRKDN